MRPPPGSLTLSVVLRENIHPEEPSAATEAAVADRGITLRAVLIGFIAIIPGVFWGVYGDVVSQTDLTSTSLMMPPVLILMALLLVNALVRRFRPSSVLTQSELMTIYVMLTVSVILSGMGMIQFLCTTLGAVPYYKSPENNWGEYLQFAPRHLMPRLSAIQGFYQGGQPVPWDAWLRPVLLWSGFLFVMLFCMLCINTLVRRQWMDRERLTFPIVMLPLEMTDPRGSFFRNKAMWLGFLVAAGVETLNSLNHLYPTLPYIQIRANNLGPSFAVPPWNAIGYFPTTFYPLAIGLAFIVAADVSFSCWFFYLFMKLEHVFVAWVGWEAPGGAVSAPPYVAQQGTGAFIGIGLSVFWLARRHLKGVFLHAIGRGPAVDDSNESLSYRTAVFGLAAGFAALVAFCVAAGISPLVAAAYLGAYLLFSTTITRLRAVAGPPWTFGPYVNAMDIVIQPVGSSLFSKGNLVALAYFNWFSIEMRCNPMPTQIEAMKIAQTARIRQRALTVAMLIAIVAGIAVGFWACLAVWYQFGAATAKVEPWRTWMGRLPFDRVSNYLADPKGPDVAGVIAMVYGAAVTVLLGWLRTNFVSFPFHPVGYVLAHTETLQWLWCPFLVAWTCKVLITRYAGIKGYRAALPFFLGLVLGDYVASGCWALAGSILGIQMYRCFPC